jgi:hypothetical protein
MEQKRRWELMEHSETSLEDLYDSGEDKNSALRLYNILGNLQNDAGRYCKTFDELHRSGAIDDFQYEMIGEGLSKFSLACKELGIRIDAIKRMIIG